MDYYASKFDEVADLYGTIAEKDVVYLNETKKSSDYHAEQLKSLHEQRILIQKAMNDSKKEMNKVMIENDQLKNKCNKLLAENDDLKQSCSTLSIALTRFEEERTEIVAKDNARQIEFVSIKNSLQKSYDENDKMRQSLQDLESLQSQLVSHEVVLSYLETINNLKANQKSLEATHKNLIQRYADLKSAIEEAFSKLERSKKLNFAEEKVEKFFDDPVRMVNSMEKNDISPRLIIESLLDYIQNFRNSGLDIKGKQGNLGIKSMVGSSFTNIKYDQIIPENTKFQSPWTHFEGLGNESSVPIYLRTEGKIQNILLSKRDTELIINEIWITRENLLKKSGNFQQEKFDEFFNNYLYERFKDKNRVVEFAYNFVDALKKYYRDSDCRLFSLVLNGEISEEVRNDQIAMQVEFLEELKKEELMHRTGTEVLGSISFDGFIRVLKRMFPNKGEQSVQRLERVLLYETGNAKTVKYIELLEEDENGNQGKFCELLRAQHLTECLSFTENVMESIDQFRDGQDYVSIGRFREALDFVDPHKARAEINRLLSRGSGLPIEEMLIAEAKQTLITVDQFKNRLKNGLLKKSGPSLKK